MQVVHSGCTTCNTTAIELFARVTAVRKQHRVPQTIWHRTHPFFIVTEVWMHCSELHQQDLGGTEGGHWLAKPEATAHKQIGNANANTNKIALLTFVSACCLAVIARIPEQRY